MKAQPNGQATSSICSPNPGEELQRLRLMKVALREAAYSELPKQLRTDEATRFAFRWGDSYELMHIVARLHPRMQHADWLRLVGCCWSSCDNLAFHKGFLRNKLGTEGPLWPMMTRDGIAVYEALPDVVTIYRGCDAKRLSGMCWSLDRAVAARFPFLDRYGVEDPVLVTATVQKSKILAVITDCDESEIITFKAKRAMVEEIDPLSVTQSARH